MELPESSFGRRFIKIKAKLKTWTTVEDIIEFDTLNQQFVIPAGYQVDTKVISWQYI